MSDIIKRLQQEYGNNPAFKPYISSIVFPAYKNIVYGAELTLDFPLTLLIGKNGANKSSILQALYGCPDGKSVGEYWFSTHVDTIEDINGYRPSFFYRYLIPQTGDTAEVVKVRIGKKDPDYWEPSRPIIEYGMRPMPPLENGRELPVGRSKTRWNAIRKNVLYLDFRAEISAFDKSFYKIDRTEGRPAHRSRLRKQSRPLKEVISAGLQDKVYRTKQRVFKNYVFSDAQRSIVSEILDNDYAMINYIEHNFYLSGSFSIYVKKGQANNYSEAFAGSGETSIIRLIYALEHASNGTLVLLDEPETSLHIEAQIRLRDYILEAIRSKRLQVVVSTHSPFFAHGLPDNAIKILKNDDTSQRIEIINSAPANESSFYLGYRRNQANKVNIMVEDVLMSAVAQYVYNKMLSDIQRDKIVIKPYSGGANALMDMAVSEMLKGESNVCFIFDGDQKKLESIPDPDTIASADDDKLPSIIEGTFGYLPRLPLDSNNPRQRIVYMRDFLNFARTHFKYTSFSNPETLLVSELSQFSEVNGTSDPKKIIRDYASSILSASGNVDSANILTLQRQLIAAVPLECPHLLDLKELIVDCMEFSP